MDSILQQWKISYEDIQLIELIESKSYCSVYKGLVRGQEALIKRINIESLDEELISQFIKEAHILSTLRNPNIVLFMGICLTRQTLQIITEYMPKGSVKQILKQQQYLSQQQISISSPQYIDSKLALTIANDVVLAMNWLHHQQKPIIHLNIKPANILLGANHIAKVSDFRLCRRIKTGESTTGAAGSGVAYMAPELLQNKSFDEKCDVYSFAITLWEMLTAKEPYSDGQFASYPQLIDAITERHVRPPLPTWFSPSLCDFLNSCWSAKPSDRPSFQSIIENKTLDHIMIDLLIPGGSDQVVAREFWANNFLGRCSVTWEVFIHRFAVYFGIDLNVYGLATRVMLCLKWILIPSLSYEELDQYVETPVTLEQFNRFVVWFGPLKAGCGPSVLERMWSVVMTPGFHGDVSTQDINLKLAGAKPGSYLIRFSTSDPGCYAVSYVGKAKEVINCKVHYKHPDGFHYPGGSTFYSSFEKILASHPKSVFKTPILESKFNLIENILLQSEGPAIYTQLAPNRKV